MAPEDFIRKWERSTLKESAAAQSHFNDLCDLLDEPKPTDADQTGDTYTFEKGAIKSTGSPGFADVWKKGHFGWEYKGPKKDLDRAHRQLLTYSVALENPPLLIVSDTKKIIIRTNWTNTVQETHELSLDDLLDAGKRDLLKSALSDPKKLKPKKTRTQLTKEAADEFSDLAQRLRGRDHDPRKVAHFVNRLVFCMFAEDVGLLPNKLFEKALRRSEHKPEKAQGYLQALFAAMKDGGEFGLDDIPWFNGGLFDDDEALPLDADDVALTLNAAKKDWADIDPSILGTLFERGLDPSKRAQLGAHYTDRDKIMMIVGPVIVEPLTREWEESKAKLAKHADTMHKVDAAIAAIQADAAAAMKKGEGKKAETARQKQITAERSRATRALNAGQKLFEDHLERLRNFRVLDPACGSGNFLNLSLTALKTLEHNANIDAEALGFKRQPPRLGPETVKGIEINPYAAELARVSIWIGEIQWMLKHGFDADRNPILRPLGNIECRDALIEQDEETGEWREAVWPDADVIVGNPPFLGAKKHAGHLDASELNALRKIYGEKVRGLADLVVYWFVKASTKLSTGSSSRFGLVATNSIRDGASQESFIKAIAGLAIISAHSDEPWVVDGASVRVSLIIVSRKLLDTVFLNGKPVKSVTSKLEVGLGANNKHLNPVSLKQNRLCSFIGIQKNGPFDIEGDLARDWLSLPTNPNSKTNADVLHPLLSGRDITTRFRDRWIVDFFSMSEIESALFEEPFKLIEQLVKPDREKNKRESRRRNWWLFGEVMPKLRSKVALLGRYISTSLTAKHRFFIWSHIKMTCDSTTVAIARDDDTTFGILHSKFHELWSLRMCTWLGKGNDPRYTPTTCFETFPVPEGLTPDIPAKDYADDPRAIAIAGAAARLNELRENWLNPPDLVKRVPEVVEGYPDRILPVDEAAAIILKKRTLTNLYNQRPAWLDNAHKTLDAAVAGAYGWANDFEAGALTDEEILKRLFELNQARALPTPE